jgi:MFS family permease
MVNERGFERAEILQHMGWIGIVAGISGNLFGGIGSDWFTRKTGLGRPMFLFWIMLALAPVSIGFRVSAPDSIFFWAGIFFGFFQIGAFYGPTFATLQELVPPQIRSTIVAFNILLLNLVGVALGITVAGIVVDVLIARGVEQPYSVVLLAFVFISLLAIPCFLVAGLRFKRDKAALYRSMNAKLDDESA